MFVLKKTFELVNSGLDNILNDVETWSGITPYGNATLVADYLSVLQKQGVESVLLVSHLPLVGSIVSELYGKRNPISFYPSTIVQIDWNGEKGTIEAFHYPKIEWLKIRKTKFYMIYFFKKQSKIRQQPKTDVFLG